MAIVMVFTVGDHTNQLQRRKCIAYFLIAKRYGKNFSGGSPVGTRQITGFIDTLVGKHSFPPEAGNYDPWPPSV
jgi:hypothetical protein